MLETRLTQDLRTTVDLIVRDLRRAGYWGHAGAGANPYAFTAAAAPSDTVSLRYSIDAAENDIADSTEQFGFRLRGGAIEAQLGAGNWQALTDPGSLTVNAFSVTPEVQEISLAPACTQQQRDVTVVVSAALASDARITRTVRTRVRVRSNTLVGTCPF